MQSISMLDIGSIHPSLQKVSKYDSVIIIVLKSQSKIFLTSQVRRKKFALLFILPSLKIKNLITLNLASITFSRFLNLFLVE